jgi:ABC-type polysaccharide/polyol phosphate export permease
VFPREALLYPDQRLFSRAWSELRSIRGYRDLLRYIVGASLRTENTGTVFGFLWWLIDPILLMLVYIILVQVVFNAGEPDYPIFIITAIIAWEYFNDGTRQGMATTLGRQRSMRQVAFPRAILPLAATTGAFVHFLMAIPIVIVSAIFFGISPAPASLLVLPLGVIQFVFTLGMSYLLSSINVIFRDTRHLVDYGFRVWFFLSPALYTVDRIPARYRHVFQLNPFAQFFTGYRAAVIDHRMLSAGSLAYVSAVSIGMLVLGYLVFVKLEPLFAKVD